MAKSVVFVAAVIFVLVLVAMILAVGFATQGAMAGNREIIEVLHFVGAADSYISRQFQRHFFRLGLRGGAIGGGLAILAFLASGALASWLRATPGGDQMEAMFGDFSLGLEYLCRDRAHRGGHRDRHRLRLPHHRLPPSAGI